MMPAATKWPLPIEVGGHLLVDGFGVAIHLAGDRAGEAVARHVAHRVVDAALDQRLELSPVRVGGQFRIRELQRFGDHRAVLRPERIGEGERRRRVAEADDDREVARFQAVAALAAVEVVVREAARLAQPAVGEGVEEEAMLAGNLLEPVVLGVSRRLPGRGPLGRRRRAAEVRRRLRALGCKPSRSRRSERAAAMPRRERKDRRGFMRRFYQTSEAVYSSYVPLKS